MLFHINLNIVILISIILYLLWCILITAHENMQLNTSIFTIFIMQPSGDQSLIFKSFSDGATAADATDDAIHKIAIFK